MDIPTGAYPENHIDPKEYEPEEDIGLIMKSVVIDVVYEGLFKEED